MTDNLSPQASAFLVLLMAEGADLSNNDLRERYRFTLSAGNRRKLNDLGLVETDTTQRPHVHRLTDAGWARCYRPLDLESTKARAQGAALTALLAAVHRHLDRSGLGLAEFSSGDGVGVDDSGGAHGRVGARGDDSGGGGDQHGGSGTSGGAGGHDPREVMARIRAAYRELAPEPGAWVGLRSLRASLGDLSREEIDGSLRTLEQERDVHIVPESNQKSLTDADRAAALWIGGQHKHAISIGA